MFGIFSRKPPKTKPASEDEGVSTVRIDRALRRQPGDASLPKAEPPTAGLSHAEPAPIPAPEADLAALGDGAAPQRREVFVSRSESPTRPDLKASDPTPDVDTEHPGPVFATAPVLPEARQLPAEPLAEMPGPAVTQTQDAGDDLQPGDGPVGEAGSPAAASVPDLAKGFVTSWSRTRTAPAHAAAGRASAALAMSVPRPEVVKAALADSAIDSVPVPRAAFDNFAREAGDYDLVRAVVTFVDTMLVEGLHTRAELPARTLQLYHADQYLAHVNAGGHRRMVHAVAGGLASMLAGARMAFAAIGAATALEALNRFTDWIAENPEEAARPVAGHDRVAGLPEELDRLVEAAAMADTLARAAAWIAGWDDLVVVDDADHVDTLRGMALANPLREHRQILRSIRQLHRQLVDPVLAATGMACAACPDPEIRLAVEGPLAAEIQGLTETAYAVRTNEAVQRLCVMRGAGAMLFEQAPTPPTDLDGMSEIEDMEQALATGRLPGNQLPRAGRLLAQASRDKIDAAIALAERYRAAAAIDLLLRRAELECRDAAAAPAAVDARPDGDAVNFVVAASGSPLFVVSTPEGAILVRPRDMHTLVSVSTDEIVAHAAGATPGAPQPRSAAAGSR